MVFAYTLNIVLLIVFIALAVFEGVSGHSENALSYSFLVLAQVITLSALNASKPKTVK